MTVADRCPRLASLVASASLLVLLVSAATGTATEVAAQTRATAPPQSTVATIGNQQITLKTPSPAACTASTGKLAVALTSRAIGGAKAIKLRFESAASYLDKGLKQVRTTTEHLPNGKTKRVRVTTYAPNATAHHVPVTFGLKLVGLRRGTHSLTVKLSYQETTQKHGHKTAIVSTTTIATQFAVC